MARLSSDGKYVIVEKNDTLSEIAEDFCGSVRKVAQLAAINNIPDVNLIHTGDIIYLTSSGSGSSSKTTTSTNQVTIDGPHLLSTSDDTLYATWTWGKEKNTESYKVVWTYDTGDGVEWVGTNTTITVDEHDPALSRQHTFTIPKGAKVVYLKIMPISKKKGNNDTTYFTGKWSTKKSYNVAKTLDTPSTSVNISLTGLSLKAEITGSLSAPYVEFQLVKDDTVEAHRDVVAVNSAFNYVSYTWTVVNDSTYKVRYRLADGSIRSEWSEYSSEVTTAPVAPDGITTIKALSESSVYLEWPAVATATGYEIEYTTDTTYFDSNSDEVHSKTIDSKVTHTELTNIASGDEYFFRLRAVNSNASTIQESEWTEIVSIVIGTVPSAPTTWSSSYNAIVGEPLTLYWAHNCEDGSKWRLAEIRMYINGVLVEVDKTVKNESTEEDEDTVGSYVIDTSVFTEGTTIDWQVRTLGIVNTYGEWSTSRTVDIHANPTFDLSVTDINGNMINTLTSLPFYVKGLAGPSTQIPLSYHLSIISNETYETVDNVGNTVLVSKGSEVYSKHFDTTVSPLMVEFSAGNVNLENGISYSIVGTAAMNSGLVAESTKPITVSWVEVGYLPDAAIGINKDTLSAQINPYCETRTTTLHKVTMSGSGTIADPRVYIVSTETLSGAYGTPVTDALTTTGEQVYSGTYPDGTEGYYCSVETAELVSGITLSVYRRESDGRFTEIASGIDNNGNAFVTDPHPALDYARYRVVATAADTGAICYSDIPAHPVECPSIVIQWDESWSNFDATSDDALAQPPWSGSMLKLPYNVDVSDTNQPDVNFIEYVGRSNPVSYYGTQIGQSATWNTEIVKTDKETLYALRRLAIWMGDVYVREPSGSGYWANVKVNFSQKHLDLTIPVTFVITRVEGGV